MKVVVGLGNPGREYTGTRHNVGFEVVAEFARRHAQGRPQAKFQAEIVDCSLAGEKVLIATPLTFMNLSGRSVRPLLDFYKLSPESLLVICDDLSLPNGQIRTKGKGSSGGQKGLQSIIQMLGTQDFPRLRIGIDPTPPQWETADYVLGKFNTEQRSQMDSSVYQAANAVEIWVKEGLTACMNQFNIREDKKNSDKKQKKEKPVDQAPEIGGDDSTSG